MATIHIPKVSVTAVTSQIDKSSFMTALKDFVSHNKGICASFAVAVGAGGMMLRYLYDKKGDKNRPRNLGAPQPPAGETSEQRARVDKVFVRRILRILKILFPKLVSKESAMLGFLSALLVARTFLSVEISDRMGEAAKSLVDANYERFLGSLVKIALVCVPGAFVNSFLRFATQKLSLLFRRNLVRFIHQDYLSDLTFYRASNLSQQRIDQADQRITQDIDRFCSAMSDLYTSTFKPVLDVILFSRKLARTAGAEGPSLMFLYYFLSGTLLRTITPPFGKLTSEQQKLEGEFRNCHSRLIRSSEEIAFYGGGNREREIINASFDELYRHTSNIYKKQGVMGIFENFFVKYAASIVGYCICAIPVFSAAGAQKTSSMRTQDYVTNTQLLLNLARAIGQLVMLYRRVMTLAGYTSRVSELVEMMSKKHESLALQLAGVTDTTAPTNPSDRSDPRVAAMMRGKDVPVPGLRRTGDFIKFEHVDIVTPDRTVLATNVNFEIRPGTNWLISGPNGCGKSSLFRILGGLWPVPCGTVTQPDAQQIFYIPQRPYMVTGTLRDQIIYPHSFETFKAAGGKDEHLDHLMDAVFLSNIVKREGGWDVRKDWYDVLSGGEKQRVAMARLFYHRPIFAILDECTSATSVDVEGQLYLACAARGITLLSISHRPQLRQYHQKNLHFDGNGHAIVRDVAEISDDELRATGPNRQ